MVVQLPCRLNRAGNRAGDLVSSSWWGGARADPDRGPQEDRTMQDRSIRCSRRKFLAQAAGVALAGSLPRPLHAGDEAPADAIRTRPPRPGKEGRKPIALICTVYRPL